VDSLRGVRRCNIVRKNEYQKTESRNQKQLDVLVFLFYNLEKRIPFENSFQNIHFCLMSFFFFFLENRNQF